MHFRFHLSATLLQSNPFWHTVPEFVLKQFLSLVLFFLVIRLPRPRLCHNGLWATYFAWLEGGIGGVVGMGKWGGREQRLLWLGKISKGLFKSQPPPFVCPKELEYLREDHRAMHRNGPWQITHFYLCQALCAATPAFALPVLSPC